MRYLKLKGIILSSKPFFENDKLITIFSPEIGRCRLLAKGASKKNNKFLGRLEPINNAEFVFFKGKSFSQIIQCDLINPFSNIRQDFNKISLTAYFFDLIRKITVLEQQNEQIYHLLLNTVVKINESLPFAEIKNYFYSRLLQIEGLLSPTRMQISEGEFISCFSEYTGEKVELPTLLLD